MIKSFTAITREIDDPRLAADEILAAIDPAKNLLAHSIGIITCFTEFNETGALKAICDALPFDCIGATTCLMAVDGEVDQIMLGITVLTSDDCRFETEVVPIDENYRRSMSSILGGWLEKSAEKPALILSYFPLINEISGDMILEAVDHATGGIPLFGTATIDHLDDYAESFTIHNGCAYRTAAVFASIYGNPQVICEVASLDETKIRKQKAVITGSSGNLLSGVNGKTALEYLEEIGLTKQELATGLGVVPLVVDHKDGTKPVVRAVFALTSEGYAVCGGAMPEGATLGLGRIDAGDVLATTETVLKPLCGPDCAILSYSCMARYLALGAAYTAEAEKVVEIARDTRYMFSVSGGEICPLPDQNGALRNFYHNYTVVFCSIR